MDFKTEAKEFDLHFKKEAIKDAEGNKIADGRKHPSLKLALPVLTAEGILGIIEAGGKDLELLLDVAADVTYSAARNLIGKWREANPEGTFTPEMLDVSKISWTVIANTPKAERASTAPSDEEIKAFVEDYKAIMPAATGRELSRIEKHCKIIERKFGNVKGDKKALGIMADMLNLWAATTTQMEDMQETYAYFQRRVDTLLKEDEKILADAL